MPTVDIVSSFLLVLPALLYIPAAYYSYKLAYSKGIPKFYLLLLAIILLFVRRIYLIATHMFSSDIVDDLLADFIAVSLIVATREIYKSFSEIFKPITQQVEGKLVT